MAFDSRPTEDILPWPGNANMAFDSRPKEDVLPWPGNTNMAFDSRPTKDVLPWPGNANMAFDSRPTENVLQWPGNTNMAFDSRPTKDVLPWPGNANMAFDLRPTEDVLPWPECHERTEDTKKQNMSGRTEYRGTTGPMTADTKKENMSGHVERHERAKPMTADTKKENMFGHAEYHRRTGPMTADTKKENMSGHAERHGRTKPMTTDTKKENMSGCAERHRKTGIMTADPKKENIECKAKVTKSPCGSSDTSEGSENSRSFEDSGRSDEQDTEDEASPKEGCSETLRRMVNQNLIQKPSGLAQMVTKGNLGEGVTTCESKESIQWKKVINEEMVSLEKKQRDTKSLIHLVKNLKFYNWAMLVWILISEGSISLLKILETKSLEEMFTSSPRPLLSLLPPPSAQTTGIWARCTTEGKKHNKNRLKSWKIGEIKYKQNITCWNYNQKGHFQNQCSKLVAFRDKEVHMAAGDSDDALVCLIEITFKDRIIDSRALIHATYCKEELERFKLRSGKVRLVDDKTIDIACIRDVVLKTSFGTSWTLKDVRCLEKQKKLSFIMSEKTRKLHRLEQVRTEGYAPHLLHQSEDPATMILLSKTTAGFESMRLRAVALKMLWADPISMSYLIYRIPYVPIGMRIPEKEWRGKDTSLTHLKEAAQMKCDTAFETRRVTRLSEAEISHLWARFIESDLRQIQVD
nr:hypothetical protein [Tanacetum cinerariifolium]